MNHKFMNHKLGFMVISIAAIAMLSGPTNLFGTDGYEIINRESVNEYIRLKAHCGKKFELVGCGSITFTLKNPDNAIILQGVDATGIPYDVPKFMLVAELWDYPCGFAFGKEPAQSYVIGRAGLGSGARVFGFDNADYHIALYETTKIEQAGAKADGGGTAINIGTGIQPTQWRVTRQPLTKYVDIQYKEGVNCSSAPAGSLNMREPNRNSKFPGNVLGDFQKYPILSY